MYIILLQSEMDEILIGLPDDFEEQPGDVHTPAVVGEVSQDINLFIH